MVRVESLQRVEIWDVENEVTFSTPLSSLRFPTEQESPPDIDLSMIAPKDWEVAKSRLGAVARLTSSDSRKAAITIANEFNVNVSTVYRWRKKYLATGNLHSLLPRPRGPKPGSRQFDEDIETIIETGIDEHYLNEQKKSPKAVIRYVSKECRRLGIEAPSAQTIRNRIKQIPLRERVERREGKRSAKEAFSPNRGKIEGAKWPGALIQIDHTPVDLILVDDVYRLPIGRPYLTVAIDVFTRMAFGIAISLDPPGTLSVQRCLSCAVLPKDEMLQRFDVPFDWPVWGLFDVVHADNAGEFRSEALQLACEEWGIDIHWRPVGQPQYGGHIERLMKTFADDLKELPGATFSSVSERANYDSEGKAVMTFSAFERWLLVDLVGTYHNEYHEGIKEAPLARYKRSLLGDEFNVPRGLPARIADERKFRIDFLPFVSRTVQKDGITINDIQYYSDELDGWIGSKNPDKPTEGRLFIVRFDPRDLSTVYFFDPVKRTYYEVPYSTPSAPPMSKWELDAVKKYLHDQGKKNIDQDAIFRAFEIMDEIVEESARQTKSARKKAQRKRTRQAAKAQEMPTSSSKVSKPISDGFIDGDIEPLDDEDEFE